MPHNTELAIVIPVYNEAQNLEDLIRDWRPVFKATNTSYRVIAIDDGSTDRSLEILKSLQSEEPHVSIHTQTNAGHGPAILKGYRLALDAEWIFQIDSDHQLETEAFACLWSNRGAYDLLIAQRIENNASFARRCVSRVTASLVRLLYGPGVTDANSPYRLMRSSVLQSAVPKIPLDAFAPNVLITGWFLKKRARIFTRVTVGRRAEAQRRSRMSPYFLKGIWRSTIQTIQFRARL